MMNPVGVLSAVVGVIIGIVVAALVPSDNPLLAAVVVASPAILGAAIWLASGAGLIPTLSWTVPVAAVLLAAQFVAPRPLDLLVQMVGLLWFVAMMTWIPAIEWWYLHILKRDPASGPM